MAIRGARLEDFAELYKIGLKTPELKVVEEDVFMDREDLERRISDKNHVFLVAEDKQKLIGFICANAKDKDSPLIDRYACLVYLVVLPEYRHKNIATLLYDVCISQLKEKGITHVYGLVNSESGPIQYFMKKQGFRTGKKLIWMDKKL
jgi:N-acetylglutamate synthase-like GNAT family acetyltransferase